MKLKKLKQNQRNIANKSQEKIKKRHINRKFNHINKSNRN